MRKTFCGSHHQFGRADRVLTASNQQNRHLYFLQRVAKFLLAAQIHERPSVIKFSFGFKGLRSIRNPLAPVVTMLLTRRVVIDCRVKGRNLLDDSSYYRVVVYIAPLQEPVLHCWGCCGLVFCSYRLTVPERLQPQPPCWFVNQLDTARRFMWNEVTSDKRPVEPAASINQRGNNHGIPWN